MSAACSGPGPAGMSRGCRLGSPGNQAHASPALLTFSVHSSCCEDRRQCRLAANSATVPTHSPAIVDPADLPAADLSPRQGAGKGSAHGSANQEPWILSSAPGLQAWVGADQAAAQGQRTWGCVGDSDGVRTQREPTQELQASPTPLLLKKLTGAGTRLPKNHRRPIGCIRAPFNFSLVILR